MEGLGEHQTIQESNQHRLEQQSRETKVKIKDNTLYLSLHCQK